MDYEVGGSGCWGLSCAVSLGVATPALIKTSLEHPLLCLLLGAQAELVGEKKAEETAENGCHGDSGSRHGLRVG